MSKGLLRGDLALFFHINGQWHTGFLDAVLPFVRNPYLWAPLYLFLLVFMLLNFNLRGLWWSIGFLATFGFTDSVSSHLIKFWLPRLRPCNDPLTAHFTRLLVPCGSGYSFPSSHAANHFGLAMFLWMTLHPIFGKWVSVAFVWAFIISYAQIYVGLHYPVDVFCGALFGLASGWITGKLFTRHIGLVEPVRPL
jgi:membrane-associated phospholipid phosphatase